MKRTTKPGRPTSRTLTIPTEDAPHWAAAIVFEHREDGADRGVAHACTLRAVMAAVEAALAMPAGTGWVGVYALGPGAHGKRRAVVAFASDAVCYMAVDAGGTVVKHDGVPEGRGVPSCGLDYEAQADAALATFRRQVTNVRALLAKAAAGTVALTKAMAPMARLEVTLRTIHAAAPTTTGGDLLGTWPLVEIARVNHEYRAACDAIERRHEERRAAMIVERREERREESKANPRNW